MVTLYLALANLKKKKGLTSTLIFLSLLAALFLNIGLIIQGGINTAYSSRARELNSPDLYLIVENMKYKTSFETYLRQDERTQDVEKEDIVYMDTAENNLNSLKTGALIFNKDTQRNIAPMHLVKEDSSVPADKAIYLPMVVEGLGASLGDDYILTYKNVDYSFKIAGFFETTYLGISSNGHMKYFVPEERFNELYSKTSAGKLISAKVLADNISSIKEVSSQLKADFLEDTDFYSAVGGIMSSSLCLSYVNMEGSIQALFSVPMVIMIAFALIICIIVIVIVHLKVTEEIDENMPNIGSLQAMGYKTGQIMLSVVEEFMTTGIAGGIMGILISYAALPQFIQYSAEVTGILWNPGIHIKEDIICLLIILALITISACLAVRKIRKLPPVTAFRKGVENHHFGRNIFPLDKGRGSIYWRLSLKNMTASIRPNITTAIVVALGVFAIGISLTLYANFAYDRTAITQMVGMEISDVQVKLLPNTDINDLLEELEAYPQVEKTNPCDVSMVKVDGKDVLTVISSDFDKMEILSTVRGDFPKYDNEIVLTSVVLDALGKDIGDTVHVSVNGNSKEYYIVGVNMSTNNNGSMGIISLDGFHRISPYYKMSQIDIYLKDGISINEFIDKLYVDYKIADSSYDNPDSEPENIKYAAARAKADQQIKKMLEEYGVTGVEYAVMLEGEIILSGNASAYKIKEITNMMEYLNGQLDSYTVMMSGMVIIICLITFLIIGTIISITIKSFIRKQREELGTYKALGYSTKELVKIISLNFTANAFIGSLLGGIICQISANSLLQIFFSNLGLDMANFEVNPLWTLAICLAASLYICLLSRLRAYRVKQITVYELLTE